MGCRASTSRSTTPFKKWGEGTRVTPEEPWQRRVLEDAVLWDEYGCYRDPRTLPAREFQAHLAILDGKQAERKRRRKKAERRRKRAGRGV